MSKKKKRKRISTKRPDGKKRESHPGTKRGDSYCARSYGIKQDMLKRGGKSAKKAKDPNSKNNVRRRAWGCKGKKSVKK